MPSKKRHYFFFIPILITFILSTAYPVLARTYVDIPVGSWVYEYFERLETLGLIKSGILSSRPFSRIEGARLTAEVRENWNSLSKEERENRRDVSYILARLEGEFRGDIIRWGYFKPVDTFYVRYLYNENEPDHLNTNNNGDKFHKGDNTRLGISSTLKLGDLISFYVNPEFRDSKGTSEWFVLQGYATLGVYNADIIAGRESMWWGPGVHGSFLLSNNAEPLDMIRVTSRFPFLLPWFFKKLGPFKPTIFLTELEKDRAIPEAKLLGMRFDFKPRPFFRFALSRVIMFDGKGRKGLTLSDWLKILIADDTAEHSNSPINNNNILSLDFSLIFGRPENFLSIYDGLKIYGEIGAEDSSGNGWPKERAYMAGLFIVSPVRLNSTSLRIEWASTALNTKHNAWYTHGVYASGYTYKGNIMGHHIGADGEDIYARLEYNPGRFKGGLEIDRERKGLHSTGKTKRTWIGLDLSYYLWDMIGLETGYGIEKIGGETFFSIWTGLRWDL